MFLLFNDHLNPLCVSFGTHTCNSDCLILLYLLFFESNKAPFRTRVETAQPLFNDVLAFFMTPILSIKLIVLYVLSKKPQTGINVWVGLNWLFNVTIKDISVIHVTAHRCAGGLKKKLDLRSGFQRHRHFVGFFNVPVLAPTRDHPFYTVIPTHRPI